jgi:hypothetical protein
MRITGNKNADSFIKVGLIAAVVYAGYKVASNVLGMVQKPVGLPAPVPTGCNISSIRQLVIRQQMDKIYDVHSGWNIWNHPEHVNVILGYDLCELQFANNYFIQTYAQSLYSNIYGEVDLDGDYTAALNYLRANGFNK